MSVAHRRRPPRDSHQFTGIQALISPHPRLIPIMYSACIVHHDFILSSAFSMPRSHTRIYLWSIATIFYCHWTLLALSPRQGDDSADWTLRLAATPACKSLQFKLFAPATLCREPPSHPIPPAPSSVRCYLSSLAEYQITNTPSTHHCRLRPQSQAQSAHKHRPARSPVPPLQQFPTAGPPYSRSCSCSTDNFSHPVSKKGQPQIQSHASFRRVSVLPWSSLASAASSPARGSNKRWKVSLRRALGSPRSPHTPILYVSSPALCVFLAQRRKHTHTHTLRERLLLKLLMIPNFVTFAFRLLTPSAPRHPTTGVANTIDAPAVRLLPSLQPRIPTCPSTRLPAHRRRALSSLVL